MSQDRGSLAPKKTRTDLLVVEEKRAVKKKTAGSGKQTAKKKRPGDGTQPERRKTSGGTGKSVKKRPADGQERVKKKTATDDRQPVRKRVSDEDGQPVRRRVPDENGQAARKKSASAKTESGTRKPRTTDRNGAGTRNTRRDEERIRRKEARLRKVRRQKITIAVLSVVIAASILCIVLFCTPAVKLSFQLYRGDKCAAASEYEKAQEAYEKALEIDSASVDAYRGMAGNYLSQEKLAEAGETYYTGWEQTKDEGLLHNYCVVIYNEAVAEINAKNCTLSTVDKCIRVLESEPANENALELMGTCYERLFKADEEETCGIFSDEDVAQETCSYTEYEQLLRRLISLQQNSPSDQIKGILTRYALIDMPYVRISIPHLDQYIALLTEINGLVNDGGITETLACLSRAKEVEDYFAGAFTEFEQGNYAYARELVAQESYQQIRDDFIAENSGYWEGSVYIPVNREQLVLHNMDGQVKFSFLGAEDDVNHHGIILVWGMKQEDDGVQRSGISYVPASDGSGSDTEYTVQYLYSNVKINGKYVPQMNYRFDTKVTTPEGVTTTAIGDWGGEHEFEIDYENDEG